MEITEDTVQELFDLVNTINDAVYSIAEENEPDWVMIEGPVWFDREKGVFNVTNTYHPGCDCCSFMTGVTKVNYEAVVEYIRRDKIYVS